MALAANTIWNSISTGNDANGGGFNPASANMPTDLVATNGNTSAPVVTSASCSFVAGDVGAWIFVQSGTNWIPGWYQIASVATGAATLTATIGSAYLYENGTYGGPSTVVGCATTASPTAGKYSIDFSTLTTAISMTSLASAASGATLNSAASARVCHIGNIINLTAGTNITTGWYEVTNAVAATSITMDRTCCSAAVPANGAGSVGGSLATPGKAGGLMVGGNKLYAGLTQSITSATANVSNGCVSLPNSTSALQTSLIAYNSTRGDNVGATWTASGINTFTVVTGSVASIRGLTINCASLTSSRGISGGTIDNCTVKNCTNTALYQFTSAHYCEVNGCTTQPAVVGVSLTSDLSMCNVHDNTVTGVQDVAHIYRCQIVKNTGSTSYGIQDAGGITARITNCTIHGNGCDGINIAPSSQGVLVTNCVIYNNGVTASGYGAKGTSACDNYRFRNCAFGSNSAGVTLNISSANMLGTVTLTVDPFTVSGSSVFILNNTAGGGASCKGAGWPISIPAGLTSESLDIGVAQSAGTGSTTVNVVVGRRRKTTRLSPAFRKKIRRVLSMNFTNVNVIIKRRRKNIRLSAPIKKKARKILNQVLTTLVIKRKRKTQRLFSVVKKRRKSIPQPPIVAIVRRRRRGVRSAIVICKKKHGKVPALSVFTTINNIILKKRKKVFSRSMTLTMKSKKSRRNGPIGSLNAVMINKRRRKSVRPLQVVVKKRKQKVPPQIIISVAMFRKRRKIARYPAVFVRPRKISAAINKALFNVIVTRRRRVL